MSKLKNVLGTVLKPCCFNPKTGFYRDGYCRTDLIDFGKHTICAVMTEEFLEYSAKKGNDLSSPNLIFNFPGLKPGDRWCLCASRWRQAYQDGVAPQVILESCDQSTLKIIKLQHLLEKSYLEKIM